jgi:hypothetical protein
MKAEDGMRGMRSAGIEVGSGALGVVWPPVSLCGAAGQAGGPGAHGVRGKPYYSLASPAGAAAPGRPLQCFTPRLAHLYSP